MSLYDFPNATSGVDAIIVDTVGAVDAFIPMLLVFVFCLVLIGGSNSQKRRTGFMDMPLWTVIASMSTLMITLPLTLTSGLIQTPTLAIVVVVTIASGFWFFMSRNRYEV